MSSLKKYSDLARELNVRASEFDQQIAAIKAVNDNVLVETGKLLDLLSSFVGCTGLRISCSICCTRERDHILLPCGHCTFCANCAERCRARGRCPTCRTHVEQAMKVYM